MTTDIQVFKNEDLNASIRTIEQDGQILFCGKDVATVLGYANPTKAIRDHCKGGPKRYPLETAGGLQEVSFITEPDLYRLIVGSKLPSAQRFEAWIFEDVLPTIRRTGHYGSSVEDHFNRLLQDGAALIEAQKAKLLEIEPKAAFAEAVEESESLHSVGELAKVISQAGVSMGQKRLFGMLRRDGWLMKVGKDRNLPTQKAREMDVIRIEMGQYVDGDGANCTTSTPRITGKGMTYFFRIYGLGKGQLSLAI